MNTYKITFNRKRKYGANPTESVMVSFKKPSGYANEKIISKKVANVLSNYKDDINKYCAVSCFYNVMPNDYEIVEVAAV
jgi:hypothetical protein